MMTQPDEPLSFYVEQAVNHYLDTIGDEDVVNLYELFLGQLEKPLLIAILEHTNHNQSKTAKMLGLNRGTLRTKLKTHGLL